MRELTVEDVPVLIEAAKIACDYCRRGKPVYWPTEYNGVGEWNEFHQRPIRDGLGSDGKPSNNFQHGGGSYCRVYPIWGKIEELECQE